MRPAWIVPAFRNPIAAAGIALTTAAALLFAFLVALQLVGFLQNPYVGIVIFVMVPGVFLIGLLLIPVGLWSERRRVRRGLAARAWPRIDLNDPSMRRMALFLAAATLVNLFIVSIASYGAVEYTASQDFCGQVCHAVMEPEFVAHQAGPHGRIGCVACHVGPGAQGFIDAKLSGTRQLALILTRTYQRPIPTPVGNLPGVRSSCEACHHPGHYVGDRLKLFYEHADDEANTQTVNTLRLHVGGPFRDGGTGSGIHWHMNRANAIDYVTLDASRATIPYVRVSTSEGEVREYFAEGVAAAEIAGLPRRRMDCLDCHTRPAHPFAASAEGEVDAALGAGEISRDVPFIRREAVAALKAGYPSLDAALDRIERSIRNGVTLAATGPVDERQLAQAVAVTQALYRVNVFPAMNVTWGTYVNQLGHTEADGCFRCHDDRHRTTSGLTIAQNCDGCHSFE